MACAGGIPEKARLVAEAPQHWRPPPPFREGHAGKAPQMGQVAGVAKGHQGTIWVFHRGGRIWDGATFADGGAGEHTLLTEPIKEDVVLQLDQESGMSHLASLGLGPPQQLIEHLAVRSGLLRSELPHEMYSHSHCSRALSCGAPPPALYEFCTRRGSVYQTKLCGCAGEVLSQWGGGEFLLPHMITVDKEGNVWTTDVALHVATKWSATGTKLLELGQRLVPGHDKEHLCKPTQASHMSSGSLSPLV